MHQFKAAPLSLRTLVALMMVIGLVAQPWSMVSGAPAADEGASSGEERAADIGEETKKETGDSRASAAAAAAAAADGDASGLSKVDIQALAESDGSRSSELASLVQPTTPTKEAIDKMTKEQFHSYVMRDLVSETTNALSESVSYLIFIESEYNKPATGKRFLSGIWSGVTEVAKHVAGPVVEFVGNLITGNNKPSKIAIELDRKSDSVSVQSQGLPSKRRIEGQFTIYEVDDDTTRKPSHKKRSKKLVEQTAKRGWGDGKCHSYVCAKHFGGR